MKINVLNTLTENGSIALECARCSVFRSCLYHSLDFVEVQCDFKKQSKILWAPYSCVIFITRGHPSITDGSRKAVFCVWAFAKRPAWLPSDTTLICGFPRGTFLLRVSMPAVNAGAPGVSVWMLCGMVLGCRCQAKCSPPGLCRDECWAAPVWWKLMLLSSPESGQFLSDLPLFS